MFIQGGVFGVIDAGEFESCGVLTCSKNTVPVKFKGELPQLKTIVDITGKMIQSKNGRIIEAIRVEEVK